MGPQHYTLSQKDAEGDGKELRLGAVGAAREDYRGLGAEDGPGPSGADEAQGESAAGGGAQQDDDVVDADFEEVKDDKK